MSGTVSTGEMSATVPPAGVAIRHRYCHTPIVLEQFEECLKLPTSRLVERLSAGSTGPDKIKEETLVLLVRHYQEQGKSGLAWKIMSVVCERVQPAIVRSMKLWRLSPVVSEDFAESTLTALYQAVISSNEVDRFWEIRFWVCFERRLLSALRKHRIQDDRYTLEADLPGLPPEARTAREHDPGVRAIVAEGLAQLPDNLRTAFMLKHWAGFPESSVDQNDHATISRVLGVSARTVRNYLARAEALLNEWRSGDGEIKARGEAI